jgi:hypothetical protein
MSACNIFEEYHLLSRLSFSFIEFQGKFSAPGKESVIFYLLLFHASLYHEQLIHQE